MVLEGSLGVSILNRLEEFLGNFLLLGGGGKATHGTTRLVHVAGQFVLNLEPLLVLDVSVEFGEALLGLGNERLLAGDFLGVQFGVKRVATDVAVNRVGGVERGRLVRSVSGTLRVRRTIADNSEHREAGALPGGGVGGRGDEGGAGSRKSGEGLATRVLGLHGDRRPGVVGLGGEGGNRGGEGGDESELHGWSCC